MIKKYILSLIVALFFVLFNIHSADAASANLFLYPGSGEYNVGDNFTVQVMVNSGGEDGINAGSAVLSFDTNYLVVKQVTKTGTIFDLWTSSPTFSNKSGTISFSGGMIPPPYKGDNGTIISITFMSLQKGDTNVSFKSGMITAADGKGTDILKGMATAKYSFVDKVNKESSLDKKNNSQDKTIKENTDNSGNSSTVSSGLLPPPPKIESETCPDEDTWYTKNSVKFNWKLLADVTGVSRMITESSTSNPGPKSDGMDESVEFDNLKDGRHYFHIKFQNKNGWGPILHRKFLIDSTKPYDLKINLDNDNDLTNPTPKILFSAVDDTSGIKTYDVYLDEKDIKSSLKKVENDKFALPVVNPGAHKLTVVAEDNAGNKASSSIDFSVEALKAPVISQMPSEVNEDEKLIIRGTSFYPNSKIRIFVKEQGGDANPVIRDVKSNNDGNWSYFYNESIKKGIYKVWAKVIDDRGASSNNTEEITLIVKRPSIVANFGIWIILILILIILMLLSLIFYNQHVWVKRKKNIENEIDELRRRYAEVFSALREEVAEIIEIADKKPGLSESEKRVKNKLIEALDISEEFIDKETDDIEKEVED